VALQVAAVALGLGHAAIFGALLPYPMPTPALVLLPYFAAACLGGWGLAGLAVAILSRPGYSSRFQVPFESM
jgi:hypothetical protein